MLKGEEIPIVIVAKNKFEYLQLILWGWVRSAKMLIVATNDSLAAFAVVINILKNTPFIGTYIKKSVKTYSMILDKYKGLWYEMNMEAIELTVKFYNQEIKNKNKLVAYYNKILNTNKFEAFIKKEISNEVFVLLMELHFIRLAAGVNKKIVLVKNPINEFVIKYMKDRYKVKYQLKRIMPLGGWFLLVAYYVWLFIEFIYRGVVFNKPIKSYKLSKEATWGFHRLTLRDDIVVDGKNFKMDDIVMLGHDIREYNRAKSFKESEVRGFTTAATPKLKININKNIFNLLFFYLFIPAKVYFQLLINSKMYFFSYIFLFHKRCFPVEVLMNLYRIKCNISVADRGDTSTTIILNKYGAKDIIFHWSDLATYKSCLYAFTAHNVHFVWGDIHYDFHQDNYFVDKKINIGCIFKRAYNKALKNKSDIIEQMVGIRGPRKVVTFFDTGFNKFVHVTDSLFLEFIRIVKEFSETNKDMSVLLKPKFSRYYTADAEGNNCDFSNEFRDEASYKQFKKTWNELKSLDNFVYLDPLKWHIEEVISISDVCITMAKTSPSTIALICGKNALYFDNTGNEYFPFAEKYKNRIVFEDKDYLFEQIGNILNGRFNCKDVIDEDQLRKYDTFADDCALERLRNNLYRLTSFSTEEKNL